MQIFVPKEKAAEERRAPMVPETVKKLTSLGAGLVVEKGIGAAIHRSDAEYEAAGAQVIDDPVLGCARPTWFCGCANRRRKKRHFCAKALSM